MQRNYQFTIAYDGTRFFGWERQPGRDTIQGKLEGVLSRLQGSPVELTGAGRTDAGVHARAMVANAQLDVAESPEEIRDYMNRYLPDAIAVREVKEAAPRFHARYTGPGQNVPLCMLRRTGEAGVRPEIRHPAGLSPGRGADAAGGGIFAGRARLRQLLRQPPDEEIHGAAGGQHHRGAPAGPHRVHVPRNRLFAEYGAHPGGHSVGGGPRGPAAGAICLPCWRPGTAAWPVPPPRRRACA